MSTVQVNLGGRSYPIRIVPELWDALAGAFEPGTRILVVTDTHVARLYGPLCLRTIRAAGSRPTLVAIPPGERSKRMAVAERICREAVRHGQDRRSMMVALGGGVVGDLAGFVAAVLYRGISLVQAPTTLLAMVDSSVGGKTAVDLPEGKNLVGAFYQPKWVGIGLSVLATLPEREYRCGLAEVVKYGVIRDAAFFEEIERETDALLRRDLHVLEKVVTRCCQIKAEVVSADEHETGLRAILNFGHTLGHALELCGGYRRWRHGEAVALGMRFAACLSVRERQFPTDQYRRLVILLARLGLPVAWPRGAAPVPWPRLRNAMSTDKKARGGVPRFVLVERLGSAVWGCEVPESRLRAAFEAMREENRVGDP